MGKWGYCDATQKVVEVWDTAFGLRLFTNITDFEVWHGSLGVPVTEFKGAYLLRDDAKCYRKHGGPLLWAIGFSGRGWLLRDEEGRYFLYRTLLDFERQ